MGLPFARCVHEFKIHRSPVIKSILILLPLAISIQIGCGSGEKSKTELPKANSGSSAVKVDGASEPSNSTDPKTAATKFEIKFKNADGDTAFYLASRGEDAKLLSSDKTEIAKFKVTDKTIKVVDINDKVLGYVRCSSGRYKIQNGSKDEVYEFQRSDDGDWKLKDAGEKMLVRVKKRDYGYEAEDASDASLFKAKRKGEKTSLRDASDQTFLSTKDKIETLAIVPLGFNIEDLPKQAALAFAIHAKLGQ